MHFKIETEPEKNCVEKAGAAIRNIHPFRERKKISGKVPRIHFYFVYSINPFVLHIHSRRRRRRRRDDCL